MMMLHVATERAGPWPAVRMGGEGSQVDQCFSPSTDGNGYSHTAFLILHSLAAEKEIFFQFTGYLCAESNILCSFKFTNAVKREKKIFFFLNQIAESRSTA